ncbi:MAG: hypothetical protein EOQ50_26280 [Mesorhizobium sp.]|uniref:hypothetical protein n=1 Tax=Mesorhizobium sp. TaxID=1871066 RepID=UPI000FE6D7AD|nr:MAG: hypothetical protein EOQ50_26280 [Mesorhizobium sp.]
MFNRLRRTDEAGVEGQRAFVLFDRHAGLPAGRLADDAEDRSAQDAPLALGFGAVFLKDRADLLTFGAPSPSSARF